MLRIFRTFKNRLKAVKAADEIERSLLPGFALMRGPKGELDKRLQADEFFLSYMFGVFMFGMETVGITDDMQKGVTLYECYDKFFPGEGKQVGIFCTLRLEAGDEEFKRGVAKGWQETREACERCAKGIQPSDVFLDRESSYPSLAEHLVLHYDSFFFGART